MPFGTEGSYPTVAGGLDFFFFQLKKDLSNISKHLGYCTGIYDSGG